LHVHQQKNVVLPNLQEKKQNIVFNYLQATFEKNYLVFSSQHSDGNYDGE
jgi:hypothetical protein